MEWILRSPQFHSIFSNLGYVHADGGYHVNENCNVALEAILINILSEDKNLRTYRRSISFGENIKKDLIPLLIHAKEDKTISLLTRILVNLTIPIECLLSVDIVSRNDFGRHTIFEINNLLASIKVAFADHRATRVVIDFLKKNVDSVPKTKLLPDQCSNVSNGLLLLRNVLHIPENKNTLFPTYTPGPSHTLQNQILWNLFSQSIDKVIMKLMSIPEARHWGVTMVQFIALMYKDQHVVMLHKLLNTWLETALTESSEDNESNTPPDRGSDDSFPLVTSDPTSDSSDTGGKSADEPNSVSNAWQASSDSNFSQNKSDKQTFVKNDQQDHALGKKNNTKINVDDSMKFYNGTAASCMGSVQSEQSDPAGKKFEKRMGISETSDCGYGTQIENQESISTSSNEDDMPFKKPVYQKPRVIQRANTKSRIGSTIQERKRKKIVKRGKANILNVQGLSHKTPTNDEISTVLKEFTVDFLLKGNYNTLVRTLHSEILTNHQLKIDTSHFFWLVAYFLKFATQIESGLDHVSSVLSFDIASYLTAESVNLCEQFELAIKLDGHTLASTIKRMHLIVTAIREFVQAIQQYKNNPNLNKEDHAAVCKLQMKMCETEELRSVLLMLIRHYNPKYLSIQYLQDLIVTNHLLLMFLDNVMKLPEYNGGAIMVDHMRQFATPDVMYQYGVLLEDYNSNGEFVNDCIFTVMHHVGGYLERPQTMFQPRILKSFTSICKSEFEICDDWIDLIEYVLNTFTKKANHSQSIANFEFVDDSRDDTPKLIDVGPSKTQELNKMKAKMILVPRTANNSAKESWTEDEISSLSWMFLQCNSQPDADVIAEMMKLLKEDDIMKSKESVIRELYKQNIINNDEYKKFMRDDSDRTSRATNKESRDDDILKLCMQITEDGNSKFLDWVQKVLLETCSAKLYLEKKEMQETTPDSTKLFENFEVFKNKTIEMPVMSPVSYHSLKMNQSVPLVPWNCHQAAICKDLKFLQLLHKLGFLMPVDSGKVFIRIPNDWTADFLFEVAGKISPIDATKLRFSVDEFAQTSAKITAQGSPKFSDGTGSCNQGDTTLESEPYYQVNKQNHFATMVNYTPMPGYSYNSEASDIDSQNWFKMVQKSQELKLTLNPNSPVCEEDTSMPPSPPAPYVTSEASTAVFTPYMVLAAADTATAPMGMPTVVAEQRLLETSDSLEASVSTFSVHAVADEYYCNSACETASVASDLTRMYVSDEDERPEESTAARLSAAPPDTDDEPEPVSEPESEQHSAQPRKKPRYSRRRLHKRLN